MDTNRRDIVISRIIILGILSILLPWIWDGLVWLWNWYAAYAVSDANGWTDTWNFIANNFSVLLIIYTIICLQAAGLAEFKFKRPFLPAFFLAILTTPPVMIGTYGHHRDHN